MKELDVKKMLRERLPEVSEAGLDKLLSVLLQQQPASGELFRHLLQEGCSPTLIQAALMQHRDGLLGEPVRDGNAANEIIRQTDRLMLLLIQAQTEYWQAKTGGLESRLAAADAELQMASVRSRWLKDGEITIYNYFHEVPFMARVAIRDVRDTGVGVELNTDLVHVIAAGEFGRFAHVRLPGLHSILRLEVENCFGKRVNFRYAGIISTGQERRQNIRVLCEDLPDIALSDSSGERIMAAVRDLSRQGLGLVGSTAASLRVGDRLRFRTKLGEHELQGNCTVCWLNASGQVRFGVELDLTPALVHRLQGEVSQRQKRIVSLLRIMGKPDSLT